MIKESMLFSKFQCWANFKIFLTNDIADYIMYYIIIINTSVSQEVEK